MRKTLYKWLGWYLRPEIEQDHDLNQWIDAKLNLSVETQIAYRKGHTDAKNELEAQYKSSLLEYENRYQLTKEQIQEEANRKAINMFSDRAGIINPLHVFQVIEKVPFLGLEPLNKVKARDLQAEARALQGFNLWRIFQESLKQLAVDQAMNASKSEQEEGKFDPNSKYVMAGRMMKYNLDVIKSIVYYLDKLDVENLVDGLSDKKVVS